MENCLFALEAMVCDLALQWKFSHTQRELEEGLNLGSISFSPVKRELY